MSLEKLLAKIEEDARREGVEIVAEAEAEAERIKQQGREEARKAGEAVRASILEKAERERVKIMSEGLARSRGAYLAAQEDLYEEIYGGALKEVEQLPEETYAAWLKKTVMRGSTTGEEEILAAPYDRRLLAEGLLEEINRALREEGREGSLALAAGEAEFDRGVLLRGEKIENNLSLETVLSQVRDKYEVELLGILFAGVSIKGAHGV